MLFNKHISFKKGNEVINIDDGWDNVMDQEYYRVCSQESFSSRTRIESNQNFFEDSDSQSSTGSNVYSSCHSGRSDIRSGSKIENRSDSISGLSGSGIRGGFRKLTSVPESK